MIKKLVTIIVATALALSMAGSAFATFEDLRLIRVYYERTTGTVELATDLGNVETLISSGDTIPGSFGTVSTPGNLYAAYFAINRNTNELWVSGSTTSAPVAVGTLGFNTAKSGTTNMYTYYNSLGTGTVSSLQSYTGSYRKSLSASQGAISNAINTATRVNTEASLAALLDNTATSVTQILYRFANANTANSKGVAVATIKTYADGSTVISPPPPPPIKPDAPTNVTATVPSDNLAVISFTPGSDGGSTITKYTVTSTPGGLTGIANSSPITVNNLTAGTKYTFTVTATNSVGDSVSSTPSNEVTATGAPPITYSVTAITGLNGSLDATTPSPATVNQGSTTQFKFNAEQNYYVSGVSGCNGTAYTNNSDQSITTYTYTTDAITADCTVNAAFAPITHTVTASAGANGALDQTTPSPATVNQGSTTQFKFNAEQNYYVSGVSGCNGTYNNSDQSIATYTYTTGAITANCAVNATFAVKKHSVTASPGANGSLDTTATPSPVTVDQGSTTQFKFNADANYYVSSVTGCSGTPYDNSDQSIATYTYTTGTITGACTVSATFAIKTFTVTPSIGIGSGNGSIDPSTPQIVSYNGTKTFTVTPNGSYTATVTGTCGGNLNGVTYTTNPVTADCTVIANFSQNNHNVTAIAGSNGSVSPAAQTVADGAAASINITPNIGYDISSVTGCSGTLNNNIYTTAPIASDCTVNATFSIKKYTVTASVTGDNGTITPANAQIDYGSNATLTISPAANYHLATLTDNGTNIFGSVSANTYTITNVIAAHNVVATFALDTIKVTASVQGGNGTITPASAQINYGDNATLTITPAANYNLASLTDNGTNVLGSVSANTYTITNVTEKHDVVATFAIETKSITATVTGGNGTITLASGSGAINYGSNASLELKPNPGYEIQSVTGCGGSLTSSTTYTTGPITADCTVNATFKLAPITFTVTTKVEGNGSVTPATQPVEAGKTASFTLTPDTGYQIATVTSNCDTSSDKGSLIGSTYTTSHITRNCEVRAEFAAIPALKGDLDGKGSVDIADALLALKMAVGLLPQTAAVIAVGDVVQDRKIDIADAVAILQYVVGNLSHL